MEKKNIYIYIYVCVCVCTLSPFLGLTPILCTYEAINAFLPLSLTKPFSDILATMLSDK